MKSIPSSLYRGFFSDNIYEQVAQALTLLLVVLLLQFLFTEALGFVICFVILCYILDSDKN